MILKYISKFDKTMLGGDTEHEEKDDIQNRELEFNK